MLNCYFCNSTNLRVSDGPPIYLCSCEDCPVEVSYAFAAKLNSHYSFYEYSFMGYVIRLKEPDYNLEMIYYDQNGFLINYFALVKPGMNETPIVTFNYIPAEITPWNAKEWVNRLLKLKAYS